MTLRVAARNTFVILYQIEHDFLYIIHHFGPLALNSRATAKPFASTDGSQTFVYDYMYGIDMADAIMQVANAGLSGAVAWMVDDARRITLRLHRFRLLRL